MERLSSFQTKTSRLYLVATPIGNLEDMTFRAVKTLKEVDVIYAEDTRTSGVLLKHYGIKTPMRSFHKHNESSRQTPILDALRRGGSVALISDAGTPLISDPGESLVRGIADAGYPVVPLPGASASVNALIASGLKTEPHLFVGFLPSKERARERELRQLRWQPYTLIFYESPHRIQALIDSVRSIFDRREVVIARELTKQYEERIRFFSDEPVDLNGLKGEMVVLVEGFSEAMHIDKETWMDRIELMMEDGMKEKEAIKTVAREQNVKKNDVYMAFQTYKKQFKHQNEE